MIGVIAICIKKSHQNRKKNLTMSQCYPPGDAADMQDRENFYNQLKAVVDTIPKVDIKTLMGAIYVKLGFVNS